MQQSPDRRLPLQKKRKAEGETPAAGESAEKPAKKKRKLKKGKSKPDEGSEASAPESADSKSEPAADHPASSDPGLNDSTDAPGAFLLLVPASVFDVLYVLLCDRAHER